MIHIFVRNPNLQPWIRVDYYYCIPKFDRPMLKSCLSLIAVVVVAGLLYNMYQNSQEPATPVLKGEYSPEFRKAVLTSLEDFLNDSPNIDRLSQDGSIIDIHYKNKVSTNQYRLDASIVAEHFSRTKQQLFDNGDVMARCIYNNLIQLEASARNGRVDKITEL
ncbi:MAG: hypothetical protein AB8G77_21100 [Rhodothermales bacterium]